MWCTLINGGLLLFWITIYLLIPELVYQSQRKWFVIPRETFDILMYAFLGLFKIFYILFNLVPYIALSIIG